MKKKIINLLLWLLALVIAIAVMLFAQVMQSCSSVEPITQYDTIYQQQQGGLFEITDSLTIKDLHYGN